MFAPKSFKPWDRDTQGEEGTLGIAVDQQITGSPDKDIGRLSPPYPTKKWGHMGISPGDEWGRMGMNGTPPGGVPGFAGHSGLYSPSCHITVPHRTLILRTRAERGVARAHEANGFSG